MGSSMQSYLKVQRRVLAVLLVALALACERSVPAHASGYLVLGPIAARAYQLAPPETLPEITRSTVPEMVLAAARKLSQEIGYSPECNRYFSAGDVVVVTLEVACSEEAVVWDGLALAAFRISGNEAGPAFRWVTGSHIRELDGVQYKNP